MSATVNEDLERADAWMSANMDYVVGRARLQPGRSQVDMPLEKEARQSRRPIRRRAGSAGGADRGAHF